VSDSAQDYRDRAQAQRDRERESFERSDTDGFLSQWASGITARLNDCKARLVEDGRMAQFVGLYQGDRRVRAKLVQVANRYNGGTDQKWVVDDGDPVCATRKWIPAGKRSRVQKAIGLCERVELAPAWACIDGSGTGLAGAASCYVKVFRTGCPWGSDAEEVQP
tara:strand:+ start:1426 stop:1917 length:492 start_codon:yes stop_codon:yes gene_type:complete